MKTIKYDRQNNLILGCACALAAEIIYGFSYVFTKNATTTASAFSLLGWRFFLAFIGMSVFVIFGIIKVNFKGKNLKPLLTVAIFNPIAYFTCETVGINHTTASESGVFLACIPVASLIASTLILHKKPRKIQVIGILITLCGVLVTILAVSTSSSLSAIGYLCLLIGVISYALYSVYVDKAAPFSGAEITYVMLVSGAVVFITLALLEGMLKGNISYVLRLPFIDTGFLVSILYQGFVCSLVAFFLSNIAIAKIGVNRTSSFIGISTVVSILAGAVVLRETLSMSQLVGAAIIILGIYTANIKIKTEEWRMDLYTKVEEKLNSLNIKFDIVDHEPALTTEQADSFIEGIEGVRTKTMFLTNKKKTAYYLLIMDDSKRLNMDTFGEIVGNKRIKMASAESLYEKMTLPPGIVSPFGLLNNVDKDILVFIDHEIANEERMCFHPNTNEKTIFLNTADLISFIKALGYDINVIEL